MNTYQTPMLPWPGLERYVKRVELPESGLALHLYDAGPADAPPLLLVHGLADEADTWRHLIPPLAAQYRVLAPDLPGFGRSDKPKRAYTLAFFQEALRELLELLAVEPATLVGHSLGAAICQSLALAQPERFGNLILIGGSLVARAQSLDPALMLSLVPGLGEWRYNRLRRDPEAAYRSLEPYYSDLDGLPEADREFLYQRVNERVWSDEQRRAFLSALRNLARSIPGLQPELAERLPRFTVPTLAIWGGRDEMNSVENGLALANLQPAARLAVVAGGGHNVHQEDPEAVLAAMEDDLP